MSEEIKHLYVRAGFGLHPADWEERRGWPVTKAVDRLFAEAEEAPPLSLEDEKYDFSGATRMERAKKSLAQRQVVMRQSFQWVVHMGGNEAGDLVDRMALFWHGHFACKIHKSEITTSYLDILRRHGLGNFRDLLLGVAQNTAMLRFLNNQQNNKDGINENFARELLELFTIGHGHYTENDVKEAARAFTGWAGSYSGEFIFRRGRHDFGQKTFFGKTGLFNGDDIIDLILEKPETARFITAKIYRYFVNEEVRPEIVDALAADFYRSGYQIGPLMRKIFTSDWFYEPANRANKIKSPTDLLAGMIRTTGLQLRRPRPLIIVQRLLGQVLFQPPNVGGWPGGRSWIDNSTLTVRLGLAGALFRQTDLAFSPKADLKSMNSEGAGGKVEGTMNLAPLREIIAGKDTQASFYALCDLLLHQAPEPEWPFFQRVLQKEGGDLPAMLIVIMSLPEYQLC